LRFIDHGTNVPWYINSVNWRAEERAGQSLDGHTLDAS
jgi:hypothetical protein